MGKVTFTSFVKENVDKVIPCTLALSMLTLYGFAITDMDCRKNVMTELTQKSYVSQKGSSYCVDDLFYVQKDNKTYYCVETKVDEEFKISYHLIPNIFGKHVYGRKKEIYEYTSVDTGEVICVSNDDCGAVVEELEDILLEDVVDGGVELEDIDQSYLVMKIGSK